MIFDNFLQFVEDGRKGKNRGIPMGFKRLDRYLRGVQKKKIYLVGGPTGTGKTAFVDEAFILNPYKWIKETNAKEKLKVFYYSFEIDIESKISKWVSYKLFMDEGIIVDPEHIVGMDMENENDSVNRLSDDLYQKIKNCKEYFDEMFTFIEFEDVAIGPTAIFKQVESYCLENFKPISYKRVVGGKEKEILYYKPRNPDEYIIVIIDHIGLVKQERSKGENVTKKINLDKLSHYMIELRNRFKVTPVLVSQFNRELGDVQRQRFKELTPQLEDFKDTGNTQEDANVVIALFSPKRYNITNYLGYDLQNSKHNILDYFRAAFVIKNRGGRDGVVLATRFLGECGYYEELPQSSDFEKNPDWYKKVSDFSKSFNELIGAKQVNKNLLVQTSLKLE